MVRIGFRVYASGKRHRLQHWAVNVEQGSVAFPGHASYCAETCMFHVSPREVRRSPKNCEDLQVKGSGFRA